MKRYEKYKPSGVEWLGEIPEHWEVKRVKDLTSIISKGTTPSTEGESLTDFGVRFIKAENIKENGIVSDEPSFFISEETNKLLSRSRLKNKDLLLVIAGATTGKIAVINEYQLPANTNQAVCFMRLKKIEVADGFRFKYYFINSSYFQNLVWLYSLSSAQPNLPMAVLGRMSVYYPPFSEQTAIANYLDTKTAAIDRKIELLTVKATKYKALRRSLIDKTVCRGLNLDVPMKDSGIEWIGKIPAHWEVKRVKDQLELLTGNSISDKTDYGDSNNSIPYIATKDIEIHSGIVDYENGIYIPEIELNNFKAIKYHSILLCIEGGSAGKKIAFNTRKICFVNKLCSFSKRGNTIKLKYNFYQMQSAPWLFQFNQALNGLIGGVSISLLKTFKLITPPKIEQIEIAQCLDNQTAQIDTILTNISNQISKFTQLRKTLINDVVTGKIKVTED